MTEWNSKFEFIEFLEHTLIPDLRESGMDATADDFKTAVDYMSPPYERLTFVSRNTVTFAVKEKGKAISFVVRNKEDTLEYCLIKHVEHIKGPLENCGKCAIFPHTWCEFDVSTCEETVAPFIHALEEGDTDGLFETLRDYYKDIFN